MQLKRLCAETCLKLFCLAVMPNELSTGDENFRQPVVKPKFLQDEIQEMKEKVASSDGYVPNMGNFFMYP